ncbi:MAG: T9SS type A sorting domain-containing protein, partial [Flavobacteriales bacterium]|nr:T9SS type A sorting domain-containing protein [Flavobacteriales bacterium]
MNKLLATIFLLFTFNSYAQIYEPEWVYPMGEYPNHAANQLIKTDPFNNLIVSGLIVTAFSPVDMDPSSDSVFVYGNGSNDVFLAKYFPNGEFDWVVTIGGYADDELATFNIDNVGNVFVTGNFIGTVDFDPSDNPYNLTSNGSKDAFFAKYNSTGELDWAFNIGDELEDNGKFIHPDELGNFYISGSFNDTINLNPLGNEFEAISPEGVGMYLAKYDSQANLQWAKIYSGEGAVFVTDVELDDSFIYISGRSLSDTIFITDENETILPGIFTTKISHGGTISWIKQFDGYSTLNKSVLSDGEQYRTGSTPLAFDLDPSQSEYLISPINNSVQPFIAKYDSLGDFVWGKIFEQDGPIILSIEISEDNNLFIAGRFTGIMDIDPSEDGLLFQADSSTYGNNFFAEFDTDGNILWANTYNGKGSQGGNSSVALGDSSTLFTTSYILEDSLDVGIGNSSMYAYRGIMIAKYHESLVGIETKGAIIKKLIYPNPSNGVVNIPKGTEYDIIEIYNNTGKKLSSYSSLNKRQIDLSKFPFGIYFIKIFSKNGVYAQKIILER